jgi:glucose/arabinose dehydrogenase
LSLRALDVVGRRDPPLGRDRPARSTTIDQTAAMRFRLAILAVPALLAAGCGDDPGVRNIPSGAAASTAPMAASTTGDNAVGLSGEVVVEGLRGPTQIAPDGRGGYVVAELNGSEGEGAGRVLHLESLESEPTVLVEGLLTPTGVAVDGHLLWIMERRTLTVGPLDDPSDRTIVLDELPFNGRSEGTISPVDGGGILYDTSGSRLDGELVEGSGTLWYLAGPDAEPELFATGFKHAYAHTPLDDERWLVTEMSDGRLDGDIPPDEVVVASGGDDFAYPRCVGDRSPVDETGGTDAECGGTPPSLALFRPSATPTGIAIAPWDRDTVLVALWNRGEVVAVPVSPGDQPHDPVVVYDEIERPQHLLADGERVLLTDHDGGRVLALAP